MGFVIKRTDMELWWSDSDSNWVKEPEQGRIWRSRDAALNSISRISRFVSGKFIPERYSVEDRPEIAPHEDEPSIFVTPKIFKFDTEEEAQAHLEELRDHQLKIEAALHQRSATAGGRQHEYLARRDDLRFALSCIIRKAKWVANWISVHRMVDSGSVAKKTRKFGTNILIEVNQAIDLFIGCKERGLTDEHAKEVVMDQVTLMVCDYYGVPPPSRKALED